MSGFSRLLIRLWGVDTNTKRTQTWKRTFRLIPASHTYTYMDTHPHRHRGNSPRLETGFVRQSSSALCGPLLHSGSSRLYQPPRQDRGNTRENKKKREMSLLDQWVDRRKCWWCQQFSLNIFHFFLLSVKLRGHTFIRQQCYVKIVTPSNKNHRQNGAHHFLATFLTCSD